MSSREQLIRRLIAVAIYAAIAGVVSLLVYPEVYLEVRVSLLVSTALIALFGHKYPGLIPALSVILVAVYLYAAYVLRDVVYVLLYAEIAMLSLILTLIVPLYVLVTKLRKLDDAVAACYYIIAYLLSISWVSSLSVSLALLTGLSTLFSSVVAAASLTTYSLLLLLTTYAAQFSASELSSLRAIPVEFLEVGRESLAYEVLLKYSVALLAYFLGFLATRSAYRMRSPRDRRTARGMLLDALRRLAIAVPIALVSAYVFKAEVLVLAQTSVLVPLFVLSLSVIKSYAENVAEAYSYVLDSRELIEILKRKISYLEEVVGYFKESELESLKDLRELIEYGKLVIQKSSEAISSTMPSYLRVVGAYRELSSLDSSFDQKLRSIVDELRDLARVSFSLGTTSAAAYVLSLLDEVTVSKSGVAMWGTIHSSIPKISESLRIQCDTLERTLISTIPGAYYDVFGFKLALRDVERCSEVGARAIRQHHAHITALLLSVERQVDEVVRAFENLVAKTTKFVEIVEAYGIEAPYLAELLRIYQDHFSQVRIVASSDLMSKLSWVANLKKTAVPSIGAVTSRALTTKFGVKEVDEALANSLGPLREPLARLEDPDTPLVDLVSDLGLLLKVLFDSMGPFSSISTIVSNLRKLEKIVPLIEEYVKEGLGQGFEFEELFPLKDGLRSLWTLIHSRGGEGAV